MTLLLKFVLAAIGVAGFGQQVPSFEAATVKVWKPDGPGPYFGGGGCRGIDSPSETIGPVVVGLGRCRFTNMSFSQLIAVAYGGTLSTFVPPDQIVENQPAWDRFPATGFDVEGKAEDPSTATRAQLIQMLQQLLSERFQLKFHLEARGVQGFALVIGTDGPKLKKVTDETAVTRVSPVRQAGTYIIPKASLEMLARYLSTRLRVPVEDQTGLAGLYEMNLKWTPGDNEFSGAFGPSGPIPATFVPRGTLPAEPNGPSLFTALQEQLGLRLEPRKVSSDIIVIDHAEKPTANQQ